MALLVVGLWVCGFVRERRTGKRPKQIGHVVHLCVESCFWPDPGIVNGVVLLRDHRDSNNKASRQ
jgi:hypothetical protein